MSAGKDDDSSFDTPTNNLPTLSSVDRTITSGVIVSNGNLRWQYNYKPASKTVRATMALPATGKIYMEWENEQSSSQPGRMSWGLVRYASQSSTYDYQAYNHVDYVNISYGGSTWNGTTHINPPGSGWPQDGTVSFYSGERAALAIDCSNGKWWLGVVQTNGTQLGMQMMEVQMETQQEEIMKQQHYQTLQQQQNGCLSWAGMTEVLQIVQHFMPI